MDKNHQLINKIAISLQDDGFKADFEAVLSALTFSIGMTERLGGDLTPEQTTRVRQAVVRLSSLERKLSRG